MFKGFLVSVGIAVVLAVPTAAQGAITLEPGTKLTVVCKGKKVFRGQPFVHAESPKAKSPDVLDISVLRNRRRFTLGHYVWEDPERAAISFVRDARVHAKRKAKHRYRIKVRGTQPVRWRGC